MSSKTYWKEREAEQLKHYIADEEEYEKQLKNIYNDMLYNVQKEIDSFYGKYAKQEGITITEAKKRVAKVDIEAYERKAKKYVEDAARDRKANGGKTNKKGYYFSDKANEEMHLYNLTMKVNRLEMLKANIGLELIKGHSEMETFMEDILRGRTEEELKRQAGILGKTIKNNAKAAEAIVNASFHNATFSDRIWMHQDLLKSEISKLLQTGLIQGKNPRVLAKELRKKFDVKASDAERLMRTELARVQTDAQKQSFIRNGFDMYEFICNHNGNTCDICRELNGKHFKVAKMMPGENAPPMHPNCRCSTATWEDSEEYEAWLDFLDKGGTTEEWNRLKKSNLMSDVSGKQKANYKMYNKGLSTEGLLERCKKANEINEKYTTRKSKWSGNIVVDDAKCKKERISGRKEWSCDILLFSKCQDKTVIHEELHSRSGSYLNKFMYFPYGSMEEASVELLAREICKNERIPYNESYDEKVDALYEINNRIRICESDLDFAQALFAKDLKNRYNWLEKKVKKYLQDNDQDADTMQALLKRLRGINL